MTEDIYIMMEVIKF